AGDDQGFGDEDEIFHCAAVGAGWTYGDAMSVMPADMTLIRPGSKIGRSVPGSLGPLGNKPTHSRPPASSPRYHVSPSDASDTAGASGFGCPNSTRWTSTASAMAVRTTHAAATMSAAASPPVNIDSTLPAMASGVRAASPRTVMAPGTIARWAAAQRRSTERSATTAAYTIVTAASAASNGESSRDASASAATSPRRSRYPPRRDAVPAITTETPSGASEYTSRTQP